MNETKKMKDLHEGEKFTFEGCLSTFQVIGACKYGIQYININKGSTIFSCSPETVINAY